MKKEILLATNNNGKVVEYTEMLSPLGYIVHCPKELGIVIDVEETGTTYRENSYLKAKALSELVSFPVIADDSGFEIDALDGFPGLYSARFTEQFGKDYKLAWKALNERIGDNPNRKASFHCCICYLEHKDAEPLFFEGICPGSILKEAHGSNGFGYDPIFHSDELNDDFGVVAEETKNAVSHRGKALAKLLAYLGD